MHSNHLVKTASSLSLGAFLYVGFVAASATSPAQGPMQPPGHGPGTTLQVPDAANGGYLAPPDPGRSYKDGDFWSQILIDPEGRRVTFWWRHAENYVFFGPVDEHVVTEATAYMPNYAEWVSPLELLIAGRKAGGNTVIEIWTYEAVASKPSFDGFTWQVPARITVDRIYDARVVGLEEVVFAKENRGLANHAFIRFGDSGDVYDFDLTSGQHMLAASSNPPVPLLVPELAGDFGPGWGAEHPADGYVYALAGSVEDPFAFDALFLIDSNRDGVLDLSDGIDSLERYSDEVIDKW